MTNKVNQFIILIVDIRWNRILKSAHKLEDFHCCAMKRTASCALYKVVYPTREAWHMSHTEHRDWATIPAWAQYHLMDRHVNWAPWRGSRAWKPENWTSPFWDCLSVSVPLLGVRGTLQNLKMSMKKDQVWKFSPAGLPSERQAFMWRIIELLSSDIWALGGWSVLIIPCGPGARVRADKEICQSAGTIWR